MNDRTAYSQYNLMKFHVLTILKDQKWWWWKDIYDALPNEPKPTPESFRDYMRRLHKKGHYKTYIIRKDGKLKEEKKYLKRRYVLRKRIKREVYYKISSPGLLILSKLQNSINLQLK